jgi:hypothetical protein
MLEPLRNLVNWDNFRKGAVVVLILSAVLFGIIYFFVFGGEGRSPAPANIFRALILALPRLQSGGRRRNGDDKKELMSGPTLVQH